jgi:hypothetical protein
MEVVDLVVNVPAPNKVSDAVAAQVVKRIVPAAKEQFRAIGARHARIEKAANSWRSSPHRRTCRRPRLRSTAEELTDAVEPVAGPWPRSAPS